MKRALVLGGGFGGIATAVALRERLEPADEVVLVERGESFVMGLRKTWAITGESDLATGRRSVAALADRGIRVVRGEITAIRPSERAADIDGETVSADTLVIALGAERAPERIPGLAEHAHDVYAEAAVEWAAAAIRTFSGGRVVVGIFGAPYPCPPAPFELSLLVADMIESRKVPGGVFVFSPQPRSLPILGEAGCAAFDGRLEHAGIAFRPNTKALAVEPGVVVAEDVRIPFDLLLGVPPHRVPGVVSVAGLTGPSGWVGVNRSTLETAHPGVYAIGDVTGIPLANGLPLPKAGAFAHAEGEVVSARIAEAFAGRAPTATYDGRGMCFLETGHGEATMVHGDFYADPPAVTLAEPSAEHLAAKHAFETDRLAAWFGR
ncbi:MAG: NAD(P)/FAD-dependent oxidoreductase [Chloroflexi bacterium]|nr:NAD(P)/FAD-dependent oxidoreductase [Chloroflexota bacterium]